MRITRVHADRYSPNELEKLDIALELFSHAVNSVTFMRTIEQHERFDTEFNLSNQRIYGLIMSGDEAFTNEGVDFEADLDLTMDLRTSTDAIGFTVEERIFTFRNVFQQLQPTKLAGHYAHEYCHTLGFADPHDLRDTSRNVPYEVGRIIEELAISNHRLFITTNLNVTGDQDPRRTDNFRNATVVESETGIDSTVLPGKAKLKKSKEVKKTKKKKVTPKKTAPKKTKVSPRKRKASSKKRNSSLRKTRTLPKARRKKSRAVKNAKPAKKKIAKRKF